MQDTTFRVEILLGQTPRLFITFTFKYLHHMKIRPKHLEFCMNYLQTNDPGVAYKMTYPKAGIKSLYAAASRLMARPDVSAWIAETRYQMQERLLREMEDAHVQAKKQQVLTVTEKRAVLTALILGETKRIRHIPTKYGTTRVGEDQPVYAILRAIDLDTRLENYQNHLLHRNVFTPQSPAVYINTTQSSTTLIEQVNILIAKAENPEKDAKPLLEDDSNAAIQPQEIPSPPSGEGAGDEVFRVMSPMPYFPLPPKKGPIYLTKLNKNAVPAYGQAILERKMTKFAPYIQRFSE